MTTCYDIFLGGYIGEGGWGGGGGDRGKGEWVSGDWTSTIRTPNLVFYHYGN